VATPRTNKRKSPTRALARVGDPLVAPDGSIIEPEVVEKAKQIAPGMVGSSIDPELYRPLKRRTVKELPAEHSVLNAISVVFMYTIMGIGDREIADILHCTTDEIVSIRKHSAYADCFNGVLGEFINANSDLLTSRIASYAQTALQTVGTLAKEGKKEETKLRASIDLLDRAGVRPKDQEQRQNTIKNELRIIIVDGEKNVSLELNGVETNLSNLGDENGDSQ
jgi:hypothetical protein